MKIACFSFRKGLARWVSSALLLGCLLLAASCSKTEEAEASVPPYKDEDLRQEERLLSYLAESYPCAIHNVSVSESSVLITGECSGEEGFLLAEIPPYEEVLKPEELSFKIKPDTPRFRMRLDRFVERGGVLYDRLLSKWAILQEETNGGIRLASHARYADEIAPLQQLTPVRMTTKKGLGGIIPTPFLSDLELLDIGSATINICIDHFMHLTPREGDIEHRYGGKTYYMNEPYLQKLIDHPLAVATKQRNAVVAAILLLQPAHRCEDAELGALLQHPDNNGGTYTMPNMTTPEALNAYAAAIDFLAKRYCTTDNCHGRISHWIMHNEVDGARDWTNMGEKPVTVFTDTYVKSMRMCYNIVRQYNPHAEVFASFSHSWTLCSNPGWYTSKEIIDLLNSYSGAEGDFQWGLAYHSYPQDLKDPCTWNDTYATFSMDTQYITFKNLEVLSKWAMTPENKYQGRIKRSVWLSEAGTNSRDYSEEELQKQAAGLAYAWKKINALEGIDGIQWHNWFDNQVEDACLGLRKYPDEVYLGEAKPVWHAYQKAGTPEEDACFEQYLPIIGIPDWEIVVDL